MRNMATESDGIPIIGKARSRRDFLKLSGAGLAVVATTGTVNVASGRPAGRKAFEKGALAAELRLRGGDEPLSAARINESYPEAVVAIEGGHNPAIVGKLLDLGLYDHLIDWHLYGGYFRVMSVPERRQAIRDRGYEQPIIATEFGAVLGSGALGVTPREAAVRLFQSVPTFLAAGGKRLCYFLWGAVTPIAGPTEKGSLRVCSFERGEERIDCVWSASKAEEGKFTWATSGAIRYVDPIGRQRTARPRRGKVTIEVGFKPYLVISEVGTRLTF